ncbi:MAG: hypothetical protein K9K37_08310 [Desulfocapsa sp.]|nr:hypothetical protein [Desulfocapsa sp.]
MEPLRHLFSRLRLLQRYLRHLLRHCSHWLPALPLESLSLLLLRLLLLQLLLLRLLLRRLLLLRLLLLLVL